MGFGSGGGAPRSSRTSGDDLPEGPGSGLGVGLPAFLPAKDAGSCASVTEPDDASEASVEETPDEALAVFDSAFAIKFRG